MKYTFYIIVLILFPFTMANSQNLCTNGNFDVYSSVPNNYSQICRATGWFSPSGICTLVAGTGSPDYYSSAGSGGAQTPATWWATVSSHSGVGMSGFAAWYNSPNYREYIYRQLSTPLTIGQTYQITFWITNGISWLHLVGTNNIGVNFSISPLVQTLGSPILLTPQMETTSVIYDTAWTKVSFSYTATASYQYVTIGNFHNDLNTLKQSFGSGAYANYGAYYYIDDIVIQPAAPLPVELVSFTGRNKNDLNELRWTTASEINNDYFEIEKSADGIVFEKIGTVEGHGTSNQVIDYSFEDKNINKTINYYRLKQVDFNGNNIYSKIIALNNIKGKNQCWIYESGVTGIYFLHINDNQNGTIKIFDSHGKQLNTTHFENQGIDIKIDLSNYDDGLYLVNISGAELFQNKKLVKR